MIKLSKTTTYMLAIASVLFAGCSAKPDETSSKGEEPAPDSSNSICAEGQPCNAGREFCCSGKTILKCSGGTYVQHDLCGGAIDKCIEGNSVCGCAPGAMGCVNDTTVQVCVESFDGTGLVLTDQCEAGQTCGPPCGFCTDKCPVGERACDFDGITVLECRRVPELGNCARMVPLLSCRDVGLDICEEPALSVVDPLQFCKNECGGRGVTLPHRVCAPGVGQDAPCGVYLCDGPNALKVDHKSCFPGGKPCHEDAECISCDCNEASGCQGSQKAFCPEALFACAGN